VESPDVPVLVELPLPVLASEVEEISPVEDPTGADVIAREPELSWSGPPRHPAAAIAPAIRTLRATEQV
jgi:hypothetical protein